MLSHFVSHTIAQIFFVCVDYLLFNTREWPLSPQWLSILTHASVPAAASNMCMRRAVVERVDLDSSAALVGHGSGALDASERTIMRPNPKLGNEIPMLPLDPVAIAVSTLPDVLTVADKGLTTRYECKSVAHRRRPPPGFVSEISHSVWVLPVGFARTSNFSTSEI